MEFAKEKITNYGHKMSDMVVRFIQEDLSLDPKKLSNQDPWKLTTFALSCIVPLVSVIILVNLMICICCKRRKAVKVETEPPKAPVVEEEQPSPLPVRKPRVPRIDLMDKVYGHLEASRWMRQARIDVMSANNDLKEENGAPEWVCFKCQQVGIPWYMKFLFLFEWTLSCPSVDVLL